MEPSRGEEEFRASVTGQEYWAVNVVAILDGVFMVTPEMPVGVVVDMVVISTLPLQVATVSLDVDIPWEDNLLLPIQQEFITLFMDVPADALDRSVSLAGLGMEEFWAVARQWACMG